MIKLYVGDLAKAQHFYSEVFGATPSLELGNTAHIMTFPKGGPGLVLLRAAPSDATKQGSFIIKEPNLRTAKALALANGATEQGTFAGNPGGQSATSVDLLDPWGNQVEVLQLS